MKIRNTFIDDKLFILLVNQGYSTKDIALKLGIDITKVRYIAKKLNLKLQKLQTIENDYKIITLILPVRLWNKFKLIRGQTYADKLSYVINDSHPKLRFLSTKKYRKKNYNPEYGKLKTDNTYCRRQVKVSLHNYSILKNNLLLKHDEKLSLNFVIWFLIDCTFVRTIS